MTVPRDRKAALGNRTKPDITHVRRALVVYTARSCEYGDDKYERGNYRRPTGGVVHTAPTREDFERYRAYLRAAVSHLMETLDAMEMHQALDPQLTDVEGMKRAAYAVDTDVTPGAKVGASMLPHVSPACASLNMAITQAVDCGLLPRDPGTPWVPSEPQVTPELTDHCSVAACAGLCGRPFKPREPKVGDRVRVTEVSESGTWRKCLVGSVAELITIESPIDPSWNLPYEIRLADGWTDWVRAVEVLPAE